MCTKIGKRGDYCAVHVVVRFGNNQRDALEPVGGEGGSGPTVTPFVAAVEFFGMSFNAAKNLSGR